MKSKNLISLLILLLIFSGCGQNSKDLHPEIMKPNWTDVKAKNLKLKIGDIISIKTESNPLYGIVMDYNEDEMGIWYGICLSKTKIEKSDIKNVLFFGRKIPSGFVNTKCVDCLYLNSNQTKFHYL